MTACCGLIISLIVTFFVRLIFGNDLFVAYAWRIPFLLSVLLLLFTIYVRATLTESPVFNSYRNAGISFFLNILVQWLIPREAFQESV